jgi:hypothetical protein
MPHQLVGVSKIETDVDAKTVVVEADGSVAPEMMLEKLQKVGHVFWEVLIHLFVLGDNILDLATRNYSNACLSLVFTL